MCLYCAGTTPFAQACPELDGGLVTNGFIVTLLRTRYELLADLCNKTTGSVHARAVERARRDGWPNIVQLLAIYDIIVGFTGSTKTNGLKY